MSSDVTSGAAEGATATGAAINQADSSRRLVEESFNTGNLALADQLIAPDAVNHDSGLPAALRDLRGPEGLKRAVALYREAFPDVRLTVDDVIAADDKVVLRWHAEGTNHGGLAGFAPTGVRGSVTGITIDRWQDGKIVEAWAEWDNMGLARQLGAAPPEGSVGEKIGMGVQRLTAIWLRRKNQT